MEDKKFKKHALLSPSSAHRWLNCTPSAVAESKAADESSEFADEGSLAHALCALKLDTILSRSTKEAEEEIAQLTAKGYECDSEMEGYAESYAEFVMGIYQTEGGDGIAEIHIETLMDLATWAPESFGTSDAVVVGRDTIHVIDFKYGKGVEVSAANNPQMRLYALGAMEEFGVERKILKYVTHIFQPRISNYSSEEISVEELFMWGQEYMRPLADVAFRGLGVRSAGSWCRFCSASMGCPALDLLAMTASSIQVDSMSAEGLGNVCLPMTGPLEQWIDNVKEAALKYMLDGTPVPGYKVVKSHTKRKISDPAKLTAILRDLGYKDEIIMKAPELQTLTALEKLVGKKMFGEVAKDCIVKDPGKPTVAPESDKRQNYSSTGAFDNIKIE